jgi:hypothetical protein
MYLRNRVYVARALNSAEDMSDNEIPEQVLMGNCNAIDEIDMASE